MVLKIIYLNHFQGIILTCQIPQMLRMHQTLAVIMIVSKLSKRSKRVSVKVMIPKIKLTKQIFVMINLQLKKNNQNVHIPKKIFMINNIR